MELFTTTLELNTNGFTEIVDLTAMIKQKLEAEGFDEGSVLVFSVGSTCSVSTLEFEPGLAKKDVKEMLAKIAPYGEPYEHNNTWGDDNGAAHLRSVLMGSSVTVPFKKGKLLLGTWQQVVLLDFDTQARNRQVVLQFQGKRLPN